MNGSNGTTGKRPTVVNGSTMVPIGAALAVVCALFVTAWRINSQLEQKFTSIETEIMAVRGQLDVIRMTLANRWTAQDMKIWEQDLKIKNPNLEVPNSRDITRARNAVDVRP